MKVILEAFDGKLMSRPEEWPDKIGNIIYIALDLENLSYVSDRSSFNWDTLQPTSFTVKKGKFEYTRQHRLLRKDGKEEFAAVYKLVGID